jgi:hypothetical protein
MSESDKDIYWWFVFALHELGVISDHDWINGDWRKLAGIDSYQY